MTTPVKRVSQHIETLFEQEGAEELIERHISANKNRVAHHGRPVIPSSIFHCGEPMSKPESSGTLQTIFLFLLLMASLAWPGVAASQNIEPKCFVNGGNTYAGCFPATMIFKTEATSSTRIFDSIESAILSGLQDSLNKCNLFYPNNCKGIYRSHVSYVGKGSSYHGGHCVNTSTHGTFPYFSRSSSYGHTVQYRFDVLWGNSEEKTSCWEGGQSVNKATRFGTLAGNSVYGSPSCPASHTITLEFADQWSGNFGYFCVPDSSLDYLTQKQKTSTVRSTCLDGPMPTCGIAGNPVDISSGNIKTDRQVDLEVAGDFPISWARIYRSDQKATGTTDWQFPAIKTLDWTHDPDTSASMVVLQRGDGARLVFQGTGTIGSRSWTVFWGNTSIGAQYQVRSKLFDWLEGGVLRGFILLNDTGEKEFYGLDGRLKIVENANGWRHLYHYNSNGLLKQIEQEGGRSLWLDWSDPVSPENSSTVIHENQTLDDSGEGTPHSIHL